MRRMPFRRIEFALRRIASHSIPLYCSVLHCIASGGRPDAHEYIHSIPFHRIPFHSIPFHSIPLHQAAQLTLLMDGEGCAMASAKGVLAPALRHEGRPATEVVTEVTVAPIGVVGWMRW